MISNNTRQQSILESADIIIQKMPKRAQLQFRKLTKRVAKRQAIQQEYLRLLTEAEFDPTDPDAKEPRGIQKKVMENVNRMMYGQERLEVSKQLVSDWVARVRNNKHQMVATMTDYSSSSQNARKFFKTEQRRIRQQIFDNVFFLTTKKILDKKYSTTKKKNLFYSGNFLYL